MHKCYYFLYINHQKFQLPRHTIYFLIKHSHKYIIFHYLILNKLEVREKEIIFFPLKGA